MFENIIRQDEVTGLLREELREGRLPAALLFSGPEYSGKLSTALELARALCCENPEAPWGCGCRSCESHRLLEYPHLLMLGGRYFHREIAACADTLRRTGSPSSRFLLIRGVRKLLRRYDPILWEGEEAKVQGAAAPMQAAEEALAELAPPAELPPADRLVRLSETLLQSAARILDARQPDPVPIAQVRRVSAWARMGAAGARKIVIIENADRMLDSARNALLKILEEPPARLTFILLTSRRGAMIPTILSRLRAYSFRPRDGEAGREVLERIFREDSGRFATLDDFFRSYQEVDPQVLRDAVGAFLREALGAPAGPRGPARGSSRDFSRVRPGDDALFKDRAKFRLFLRELLEALRPGNPGGPALPELQDLSRLEDWAALARRTADSLEALNIGPEILAQRLFALFGRA